MKRLRTLSIPRPNALQRRNMMSPWGEAFWRNYNLRRRREWALRQRPVIYVPYVQCDALPGESSATEAPPAPMVH